MRLTSGHRRWVYWSAAVLFASGALWLVFHYFLQRDGQFGPAPHPLEQWWLRVHGGAAMLALLVVGSLLPVHVRRGWHHRRNLPLGIALSSVVLLLTLSGYALYYFGSEDARPWISLFHWGIGVAGPVVLVWHIVSGRSAARHKHPVAPIAEQADKNAAAGGRLGADRRTAGRRKKTPPGSRRRVTEEGN